MNTCFYRRDSQIDKTELQEFVKHVILMKEFCCGTYLYLPEKIFCCFKELLAFVSIIDPLASSSNWKKKHVLSSKN